MKSKVLKFGIISVVLAAILFLGPLIFMYDPEMGVNRTMMDIGEIIGYGAMLIAMLPVFFGTRAYKVQLGGSIGFGKALGTGMLITLVSTLIFYLANGLLYEVFMPDFLHTFEVGYTKVMMENAAGEAEKQQIRDMIEAQRPFFDNGWIYAALMASTTFMIGVVISIISALILKKS